MTAKTIEALSDRTGKKKMGRRFTLINADKKSKNLRNHENLRYLRYLRSISRHVLLSHYFFDTLDGGRTFE